jgi:glycosyltransferase involved in cell wall biosynthesis
VPVVTRVAGNPEVVEDGRTGFLAAAPSDDALDEALERAWAARADWRTIGQAASRAIRTMVPPDPPAAAATMILEAAARLPARPEARHRAP